MSLFGNQANTSSKCIIAFEDSRVDGVPLQYLTNVTSDIQEQFNESNIITTANSLNIETNTTNIASNTLNIETNTTNIASNTLSIAASEASIETNTTNITSNTSNIAENTSNIAENTTDIANLNLQQLDTVIIETDISTFTVDLSNRLAGITQFTQNYNENYDSMNVSIPISIHQFYINDSTNGYANNQFEYSINEPFTSFVSYTTDNNENNGTIDSTLVYNYNNSTQINCTYSEIAREYQFKFGSCNVFFKLSDITIPYYSVTLKIVLFPTIVRVGLPSKTGIIPMVSLENTTVQVNTDNEFNLPPEIVLYPFVSNLQNNINPTGIVERRLLTKFDLNPSPTSTFSLTYNIGFQQRITLPPPYYKDIYIANYLNNRKFSFYVFDRINPIEITVPEGAYTFLEIFDYLVNNSHNYLESHNFNNLHQYDVNSSIVVTEPEKFYFRTYGTHITEYNLYNLYTLENTELAKSLGYTFPCEASNDTENKLIAEIQLDTARDLYNETNEFPLQFNKLVMSIYSYDTITNIETLLLSDTYQDFTVINISWPFTYVLSGTNYDNPYYQKYFVRNSSEVTVNYSTTPTNIRVYVEEISTSISQRIYKKKNICSNVVNSSYFILNNDADDTIELITNHELSYRNMLTNYIDGIVPSFADTFELEVNNDAFSTSKPTLMTKIDQMKVNSITVRDSILYDNKLSNVITSEYLTMIDVSKLFNTGKFTNYIVINNTTNDVDIRINNTADIINGVILRFLLIGNKLVRFGFLKHIVTLQNANEIQIGQYAYFSGRMLEFIFYNDTYIHTSGQYLVKNGTDYIRAELSRNFSNYNPSFSEIPFTYSG